MATIGRKKVGPGARTAWDSTLDRIEESEPTQAGEVPAGLEDGRRGGDKGRDTETGPGGYGGDAVEAGHDEAVAQPDRPADQEIHGDPRTPEGAPFPDDARTSEEGQQPIGEAALDGEIVPEDEGEILRE